MHKIPQPCVCALFIFRTYACAFVCTPLPLLFVPILITATDNPIVTEQQQQRQRQPTALEVGGNKHTVSVRVCARVCEREVLSM